MTNATPNPFEQKIIMALAEVELFENLLERFREIAHLSDTEFVKTVFELYLERDWGCDLSTLHKQTDRVNGMMPRYLFQSAVQFAVSQIDWAVIAQNEKIAERIRFLRNS
jgi:hypothetical protein